MAGSGGPRQPVNPASPARDAATRVVRALREQGFVAYLAGGCVRDEVMGHAPKDYDVATDARPERVRQIFRNTQAVGEHFGVILVRERGWTVEVATFRHESGYADKRRPDTVTFTDAENDARRRDFTINGLFMDPIGGEVIDYVGGRADIDAGVIRAIGDPAARLGEDHLRALRAVRFAARFGFEIESATAAAVRRDAAELRGVSRERIGQEIRLMLLDEHRGRAAALLHELGLDGPVLDEPPCTRTPDTVARLALEPAEGHVNIIVASLAAWAHDRGVESGETVRRWRRALVLSNDERDGLRAVFEHLPRLRDEWGSLSVAARKRLAAGPWFGAALRVLGAMEAAKRDAVAAEVERLSGHAGGLAPVPLVSGDDLVAAGYEPGPKFKQVLDAVYDEQLEGRLRGREQGLALAGRMLAP